MTTAARLSVLAALALAACAPAAARQPAPVAARGVHDLMPRFWRFREAMAGADSARADSLFRALVVAEDTAVFQGFTGGPSPARVARYLRGLPGFEADMRSLSERMTRDLPGRQARFAALFPDVRWDRFDVYVMPNFGGFDAGTGDLHGRQTLVIGVDGTLSAHGPGADLRILFGHEFFHLYHADQQAGPPAARDSTPLFWQMWSEGLATYVAGRLNPESPLGAVLMDDSLAPRVAAVRPALAAEALRRIDERSREGVIDFMSARPSRPELPSRSGYYIGYLAAEEMGRTLTPHQMARLKPADVRPAVVAVLERMAAR